jgi:hypothetical protein
MSIVISDIHMPWRKQGSLRARSESQRGVLRDPLRERSREIGSDVLHHYDGWALSWHRFKQSHYRLGSSGTSTHKNDIGTL